MFNLINEISDMSGLPINEAVGAYKYVNIGGRTVYVQNYKDVLSFNEEEIILKLKDGELKIIGENLNIKDLNLNSIVISGVISLIEKGR